MTPTPRLVGLARSAWPSLRTSSPRVLPPTIARRPATTAPARLFNTSQSLTARYRRFGDPPRPSGPSNDLDPYGVFRRTPQPSSSTSWDSYARPSFSNIPYRLRAYLSSPVFLILIGGAGGYYILHLEQVPETGRWRFMDVSPAMEKDVAAQSYQEVMQEFGRKVLPQNHPTSRHVQEVVKRIVRANHLEAGLGSHGWETYVVADDSTKNAFVIPGGKIFVMSGILPIAKDSDGLAVILGHEIAHQVARHSAERMSSLKVLFALSLLLNSLGLDMGISRVLLNLLMTLPNSRKNESEADLIGLRLANNACFDPRAAESLWQRMDREAGGMDLDFLSTHPSSKNRVVKVREWAEEVIQDRPLECGPLRDHVGPFQRLSDSRW
ncbi:hypothetical protein JCM5296_003058 [Sporobolomyces johnsonii]